MVTVVAVGQLCSSCAVSMAPIYLAINSASLYPKSGVVGVAGVAVVVAVHHVFASLRVALSARSTEA